MSFPNPPFVPFPSPTFGPPARFYIFYICPSARRWIYQLIIDSLNFSFKCHRETPPTQRDIVNVYSVNAISFHPVHGTFCTAGSDGTFHFWDKDAKHRLKGYPVVGGAISATAFSRQGDIFAYAVSYDWSKGYSHHTPSYPNKVMLHAVGPEECKPRSPVRRRQN